ncbi:unnamed protein product [Blepharisma stoltei]|uniref:CS domain-containing protein n=1 Tax=Blepharisma stoltei TaxID=1481888 RepID=A0AAU9IID0_9CILI|nr:unnamed protein product [Blepharisma stoltei]
MVDRENLVDESMQLKGENSYYASNVPEESKLPDDKRITSGGTPLLIGTDQPHQLQKRIIPITAYSWNDDNANKKVAVYIEFPESVNPSQIHCDYQIRSLVMSYNYSDTEIKRLTIPRLNREINPAESTFKVRKNKVILYLKKAKDENWPLLEFRN